MAKFFPSKYNIYQQTLFKRVHKHKDEPTDTVEAWHVRTSEVIHNDMYERWLQHLNVENVFRII